MGRPQQLLSQAFLQTGMGLGHKSEMGKFGAGGPLPVPHSLGWQEEKEEAGLLNCTISWKILMDAPLDQAGWGAGG